MINERIAVGNTVHLNSGSPDLTVIAVSSDGKHVAVKWEGETEVEFALFPSLCVSRIQ